MNLFSRLFLSKPPLHTPAHDVSIRRAWFKALRGAEQMDRECTEMQMGSDYPRDDLKWETDATFRDDMARSGEGEGE